MATAVLSTRKRIAFTITAVLLAVLVIELLGRAALGIKRQFFPPPCRHPNETGCPLQPFQAEQAAALITDPFSGWAWQPGYQGEWLSINSLGFRGPEIDRQKRDGTLRIAVVGGSAALGVGVHDDETIEAYLQTALERRLDQPIDVINGGVTAYNSSQELTFILFHILELEPDLIVLYDGRNDAYFELSPTWEPHYTVSLRDVQRPLNQPYSRPFTDTPLGDYLAHKTAIGILVSTVSGRLRAPSTAETSGRLQPHEEAITIYQQNTELLARILETRGVRLILVVQPSLAAGNKPLTEAEQEYISIVRQEGYFDLLAESYPSVIEAAEETGRRTGIPVFDFTHIFDDQMETLHLDEVHLTPRGNQLVAEQLSEIILEALASPAP